LTLEFVLAPTYHLLNMLMDERSLKNTLVGSGLIWEVLCKLRHRVF